MGDMNAGLHAQDEHLPEYSFLQTSPKIPETTLTKTHVKEVLETANQIRDFSSLEGP